MKRSKITHLEFLNYLGLFGIFFIIGIVFSFLYPPVFKTNASESDTTSIGAEVAAVASVTLDTNNLVYTFTPTSSGSFQNKTVTATAKTNSQNGYEMYFSSIDNETDMVHSTVTDGSPVPVTDVISSDFTGTVTSSTMGNNKWGYSLDNTSALDDKAFSPIPTKSNQLTLKNIDHLPETTNEKIATVNIGIKVDNTLASGTYSKDLIFSVLAHEVAINKNKLVELTSMQDTNLSSYCAATYTPTSSATVTTTSKVFNGDLVPETTLEDVRDGNTYTIRKLADGNCWMTENLRLQTATLTPQDSDVTSNYNLTSYKTYNNNTSYGSYYTWNIAIANSSIVDNEASGSVCPLGWRLPRRVNGRPTEDSVDKSYERLIWVYGAGKDGNGVGNDLVKDPLNFVYNGHYNPNTGWAVQGTNGSYWSSTNKNSTSAQSLYFYYYSDWNYITTSDNYLKNGWLTVRCIAR